MSQRVRGEAEREERRRTLVEAADALLCRESYNRVRIEDVARRAGVAKGTVFLYFANKEALVLAVLRARLTRSMDRLEAELDGDVLDIHAVVQAFLDAYYQDPVTSRMLALWPCILEDGAPAEDVEAFRVFLADRGSRLATRINSATPALGTAGAERLVRHLGVMVVGMAAIGGQAPRALDSSVFPRILAALASEAA